MRALAITNSNRFPLMPELPTVAEAGIPGFVSTTGAACSSPRHAGGIVARLNAELVKVLALPEVKQRLLDNGIGAISNTPEQFAAYIARNHEVGCGHQEFEHQAGLNIPGDCSVAQTAFTNATPGDTNTVTPGMYSRGGKVFAAPAAVARQKSSAARRSRRSCRPAR